MGFYFQGKNNGMGCHFLLHGIFPTQGSNPGLPHHRQTLYHLSQILLNIKLFSLSDFGKTIVMELALQTCNYDSFLNQLLELGEFRCQ